MGVQLGSIERDGRPQESLINITFPPTHRLKSNSPVILSVDTSQIAVGYILSQCDPDTPKLRYHARFGSITLNERECRFSQPKLELYGLYRALRQLKLYLIGV